MGDVFYLPKFEMCKEELLIQGIPFLCVASKGHTGSHYATFEHEKLFVTIIWSDGRISDLAVGTDAYNIPF